MPSVKLSPAFNSQTFTSSGAPAFGHKVYTYAAGSSSPLATYTDASGAVAQANPIVLNAQGYPANPIWLQAGLSYKLVLTDSNDAVIKTLDNITGINDSSSSTSQWLASGVSPTYVSASSFTLPGDQTTEFHAGRRLQFTVSAGTVYGAIASSSFGSGLTTVGMTMDSGQTLDSGLSAVNLSILRNDHLAIPNPGSSLTANGYQKLPSGLIIQWGSGVSSGTGASNLPITFPFVFPNGFLAATLGTTGGNAVGSIAATSQSGMNITTYNASSGAITGSIGMYYIAIGY